MKKIIISTVFILTGLLATAQLGLDSVLGDDGGGAVCTSTDKNSGYCNKYVSASGGLPNYYCETASCHNTQCFDCVK